MIMVRFSAKGLPKIKSGFSHGLNTDKTRIEDSYLKYPCFIRVTSVAQNFSVS
jgi:hypothetical protein